MTRPDQDAARKRAACEQAIEKERAHLPALQTLLSQIALALGHSTYGKQDSIYGDQIDYIGDSVRTWVDAERAGIRAKVKRLEWNIKEIDCAAEIEHGPHFKVRYRDEEGIAGDGVAYIPAMAVKHFGHLTVAFHGCGDGGAYQIIEIDESTRYTHDGDFWAEPAEKNPSHDSL